MKRIAIIGAGISGLVLARELSRHAEVTLFEKSRGVGGRMSTRYSDPFRFDHGAQYFTARTAEFQKFLQPYVDEGTVAEWKGKVINLQIGKKETKRLWFEPHFVGSPNMNSLCKELSRDLDVRVSSEIEPLGVKDNSGWKLSDKEGGDAGTFDWVISTAPAAQTQRLFCKHIGEGASFPSASMQGCYALMIGFNRPWDGQWIAAKVDENPIQWISVNSSKPGRDPNVSCLVAHSRNDWAETHIDDDMSAAQAFLLEQFALVSGIDASVADFVACHRWRYATTFEIKNPGAYFDAQTGLAATGDWCGASRIEDVWRQAMTLAKSIRSEIKHI